MKKSAIIAAFVLATAAQAAPTTAASASWTESLAAYLFMIVKGT
ncbi:hypothetical protein [Chitinimonas koreensis]|nr:hypothetical protein [Chitinimonas koreensis]